MIVLTNQNEGWRVVAECRGALLNMGGKLGGQVPIFITFLKSGDRNMQEFGAVLLSRTGPKARAAVPALLALAEGHDYWVSLSVASALWNIDRQTNTALRVYADCLRSTNSTFQQLALVYLRDLGPAAEPVGPDVVKVLGNSDSVLRREAEKTLATIAPDLLRETKENLNRETPSRVANLVKSLKSDQFRERFQALETIWVLGPDAEPAVPALIDVLTGPSPALPGNFSSIGLMNSRRDAAQALAEIGSGARAAVPALVGLLNDHKDGNGAMYCRALGCIGYRAPDVTNALELALRSDNPGIRFAAANALTKIAPDHSSNAVAVLKNFQNDPGPTNIWVADKNGIPMQVKDFQDPGTIFLSLAASVPLWRLGLEKEPPVTAILTNLNAPGASSETEYVHLLGEIGPGAKQALPKLETFIASGVFMRSRQTAAVAIRKIDPAEAAKFGLPGVLLLP
jgi:HEAT repeat protein